MSSWVLESLKSTNSGSYNNNYRRHNKNLRVIGRSGGSSPGTRIPGLVKAKPTTWGKPTSVRSQLPADPTMYGEVWFGCDEDEKGEQFWAACKYQVP